MPRQDDAGSDARPAHDNADPRDGAATEATPTPDGADTEPSRTSHGAGGPRPTVTVARAPVELTYPLRGRVLRPGAPPERVHLDADDRGDTAAFAATDEAGTIVGTAIVYPEGCPWLPDRPGAWRLRGMATDESRRGAGVGARVLAAILEHVRAEQGTLVWCNARVPARRFYERAGFTAHGDVWDEPEIGPHIAMWHEL